MMPVNVELVTLLCIVSIGSFSQTIRKKTIHKGYPALTKNEIIYILPAYYEAGLTSDEQILRQIDTLPSHHNLTNFWGKTSYYMLLKADTTKLAIRAFKDANPFGFKFGIEELWENGNIKRLNNYNRKFIKCHTLGLYHQNGMIELYGRYRGGNKVGAWIFFDESGGILKKERYRNNRLVHLKEFTPSKHTYKSMFIITHENGLKYRLGE
jgi:hypothetical protein